MNNSNWYDKTWLVTVLCIVFFPVGLYALWKNSSISKIWKIGTTALITLIVVSQIGKYKSSDSITSNSNYSISSTADQAEQKLEEPEVVEAPKNQQQIDFVKLKYDLYQSKYVNAANDAQKIGFQEKNKKVTKDFLGKYDNKIINWVVTVDAITLSDKPSDRKLLKQGMSPIKVKEQDPTGRSIDFGFNASFEEQAYVIVIAPSKGNIIKPENPLYNKLLNLKTGSNILISGEVVEAKDYTTQIENGVMISIKLTDINND